MKDKNATVNFSEYVKKSEDDELLLEVLPAFTIADDQQQESAEDEEETEGNILHKLLKDKPLRTSQNRETSATLMPKRWQKMKKNRPQE